MSSGTGGGPADDLAHQPVGPTVEVRRSGGFAGITRTGMVNLAELPQARVEQWRGLLRSAEERQARPAAGPRSSLADGFVYQVRCPALGVEATLTQAATSPMQRQLLDGALE